MRPLEVQSSEEGGVVLRQALGLPEDPDRVEISRDQLPIVIQWLREAAGLPAEDPEASGEDQGPRRREARELARRLSRLEADTNGTGGALRAIRVALEWAVGDSDLSPREWLLKEEVPLG